MYSHIPYRWKFRREKISPSLATLVLQKYSIFANVTLEDVVKITINLTLKLSNWYQFIYSEAVVAGGGDMNDINDIYDMDNYDSDNSPGE